MASLLLFSKPLTWKYALGFACMVIAFTGVPIFRHYSLSGGLVQSQGWLSGSLNHPPIHVYRPAHAAKDSFELEKIIEVEDEDSIATPKPIV